MPANNPLIFNAVIVGISGGIQQRWIHNSEELSYELISKVIIEIATEIDLLIPTEAFGESNIALMQSICQGVYSNRFPTEVNAEINTAIVAFFTQAALGLESSPPPAHPVLSVFARFGNIIAAAGDYAASLITNDSGVVGDFVDNALDTLAAAIPPVAPVDSVFSRTGVVAAAASDYDASEIDNDSTVAGAFVDNALDRLALEATFPITQLYAGQLGNPDNAGFVINALAAAVKSLNDSNITIRAHDDATETGTVFELRVPEGATNMTITVLSSADSAPGGNVVVKAILYLFGLPDDDTAGPWSGGVALDDIIIPANIDPQVQIITKTLVAWGLLAGDIYQWEITRDGTDGGDTLSGNWDVYSYIISWS